MNLLTTAQAALILHCTANAVRRMILRGRIAATKAGRDWLIDPAALVGFVPRKGWPAGRKRKV
jgi:excisionase family DNA binding protein